MRVPQEIYDHIISFTDLKTAIKMRHSGAIAQLYDEEIHTWMWAVKGGHLDVLKWLHKNNNDQDLREHDFSACDIFSCAADEGNLKVVKWLYKNRPEMEAGFLYHAHEVANELGHFELEAWVVRQIKKEER